MVHGFVLRQFSGTGDWGIKEGEEMTLYDTLRCELGLSHEEAMELIREINEG